MSGRSGQEATFCSYGVYRRDQRPLYDGSQEHLCTMEATESKKETKSTKETKGPCTMEKALCSFVRWKPQRPNARVRWKRLCSSFSLILFEPGYRQCTSIYSVRHFLFFFSYPQSLWHSVVLVDGSNGIRTQQW